MTQQLANTITAIAFFAMIVGITAIVCHNRTRVKMHRMSLETPKPKPRAARAKPAQQPVFEFAEDANEGINQQGHWAKP